MRGERGRLTVVGWLRIGGFVTGCLVVGIVVAVFAHPRWPLALGGIVLGVGAGFNAPAHRSR